MYLNKHRLLGGLAAFVISGTLLGTGMTLAQEANDPEGAEVLTRGPVHEAFAGTVSYNPEAGIIVDQAPPMLIEEIPPEQRLEGDNVAWIPGYWAWDEDQSDFLWISGIWRNLPPGREWIPGYWAEIDGGHQWTSGYWEDAETTEVSYLPEPPKSVEAGPNIEASSNDQTWIPGNWMYRDDRYAWRAGYWADARPNWSWTPAYYRWTQRGHVYVDGYWDYPVASRGVVFAPVHFNRGYISRPDFRYTPATVISLSVFSNHLFLRPNYGHYYFGDYYEPRYRDRGFYASYSYTSGRRGYDPIYSHNRWENRNDRNWDRQRQEYFEYRRDNADSRPPRTWAALNSRSQGDRDRGDYAVAERFERVTANREGRQRFQKVDERERERFVSQRKEIREFGKQRKQLETRGERPSAGEDGRGKSTRERISRSPVMAKRSDRSDKDGGPPARLQPRKSERDEVADRPGNNGNDKRENSDRPNREGSAQREGEPRKNMKSEPATENRTKPGQKRDAEPGNKRDAESGNKRQADQNPKRQSDATPNKADQSPKRQEAPAPKKAAQNTKRQADPTPKRQADPTPKRQADPTPKRQADPTPKRQAEPAQKRQADPAPKRQADPTPKRQANPAPKRQVEPAQKRQAAPEPKRQAEPQPERKKKAEENGNLAATRNRNPDRKAAAQNNAQKPAAARPRPQAQQAARKQASPKSPQTAQAQKKPAGSQNKDEPVVTAEQKAERRKNREERGQ